MTDTLKIIAQATPAATTLTDVYTVPGATSTTISSLTVCNQNASQVSFRISVAIAGAGNTAAQYIYYDLPLIANDTFIATIGMTLAATDVVRVYASSTGVSFNFFGVEVS